MANYFVLHSLWNRKTHQHYYNSSISIHRATQRSPAPNNIHRPFLPSRHRWLTIPFLLSYSAHKIRWQMAEWKGRTRIQEESSFYFLLLLWMPSVANTTVVASEYLHCVGPSTLLLRQRELNQEEIQLLYAVEEDPFLPTTSWRGSSRHVHGKRVPCLKKGEQVPTVRTSLLFLSISQTNGALRRSLEAPSLSLYRVRKSLSGRKGRRSALSIYCTAYNACLGPFMLCTRKRNR